MDDNVGIQTDALVSEILDRWPETITVFLRHRMACVGCGMSGFETLISAAEIYGLQVEDLVAELEASISSGDDTGDAPGKERNECR